MSEGTSPKKEVYVGAVIEIHGQPINLIPSTPINQIDTHGLKLSLDKPVPLGSFGKAMKSICDDIGVNNPLETIKTIDFPLLKNVVTKAEKAEMRIEALQYDKPPVKSEDGKPLKEDQKKPTKYLFVASVNWGNDANSNEDKDFFKLKGLIIGVSSGYTDDKGENQEVQKAFQSAMLAAKALPHGSEA
jgi:hypothetical protein